jgi:hypothetical protein
MDEVVLAAIKRAFQASSSSMGGITLNWQRLKMGREFATTLRHEENGKLNFP